ncbi:MAG: Mercuric resistance operon regulatory protein [Caulobacter sp.]|jgi:DNA-binding transcriptional MerR regulator|nr:Mercuric resistance operon regulatory protein [Caulobacter sp.]
MTYLSPTRLKPSVASRISIGRAARLTGLTIRAIRFYEQRGLVESRRDARDIRTFDTNDLDRLAQIAELRAIGIAIDDIAALVVADALPGGEGGSEVLLGLLGTQHARLSARIARIEAMTSRVVSTQTQRRAVSGARTG